MRLEDVQSALGPDDALLSFQLDNAASWLWALDRGGLALYRLAPKASIEGQALAFARAVKERAPGSAAAGATLYRNLFGQLPTHYLKRSRWLVAPDGALFETPLAALATTSGAHPAYLIESHIVEITPGSGALIDAASRQASVARSGLFLGIGDPIYNSADPRWQGRRGAPKVAHGLFAAPASQFVAFLPRLPASAEELEACSRAWGGANSLLEGGGAARHEVVAALDRNPEVIHFATHVLTAGAASAEGSIALGLGADGQMESLTPLDIVRRRTSAEVVVLSGCHSAEGDALPGTGLMGLTRAWLGAGARAVVATRWPTPDENGSLFAAMYRALRADIAAGRHPDAAGALRASQLQMARSGDWRADPSYWAAYFAAGGTP